MRCTLEKFEENRGVADFTKRKNVIFLREMAPFFALFTITLQAGEIADYGWRKIHRACVLAVIGHNSEGDLSPP